MFKREEIEVYLQTAGQSYVTDVTNADSTFARNALRNQVIPVLEEKVSSRSVEHMGQMAEIAGLACDYLEDCLQRELERCTKSEEGDNGGCLRLILPAFDTLHPYMKGQVLLTCLERCRAAEKTWRIYMCRRCCRFVKSRSEAVWICRIRSWRVAAMTVSAL